jgi:predicted GIY-YIG superfamily endonuclease
VTIPNLRDLVKVATPQERLDIAAECAAAVQLVSLMQDAPGCCEHCRLTSSRALPEKTLLYRLYGESDRLLYVGITCNLATRLTRHRQSKLWWGDVVRHTAEEFSGRKEAERAEMIAIQDERPAYNVIHSLAKYETGAQA